MIRAGLILIFFFFAFTAEAQYRGGSGDGFALCTFTHTYVGVKDNTSSVISVSPTILNAGDVITVKTATAGFTAEIFDNTGRSLLCMLSKDQETRITVNSLSPGLYILRINHNEEISTFKIILR